jgi:hypothetical protein
VPRLVRLAEFITRNLPFAAHVAVMGLEPFGLFHQNRDELWVDPVDYQPQLAEAAAIIGAAGIPLSIYNHQLCVLDRHLWPFARKSISDWKNIYLDQCGECTVRGKCGGFFQSAKRLHSAHIAAITTTPAVESDVLVSPA